MKTVGANTTFGKLKEAVVGNFYGPDYFEDLPESEFKESIQRLCMESIEDIESMVSTMESFGVNVRRLKNSFPKPCVASNGSLSVINPRAVFTPRDNLEFIDNKCISYFTYEQPTRWWDDWAHHELFMEYFNKGAEWHQMPKGPFDDEHYYNLEKYTPGDEIDFDKLLPGNKNLYFSGANVVKFGKDIWYTLITSANTQGVQWAKNVIGPEYRWHLLKPEYYTGHVDCSIKILRPGVVLSKYPKDTLVKCIPEMHNWDVIHIENSTVNPRHDFGGPEEYYYADTEVWANNWTKNWVEKDRTKTIFDINVLSLDEKTVMINVPNSNFEAKIKSLGFDTVVASHRNRFFWGHGINCMTSDVLREDECIDYFK